MYWDEKDKSNQKQIKFLFKVNTVKKQIKKD